MKTALKILMLVLSSGCALTAFAGLVGILPASAFVTSETALFLYSAAGIMFIGLNDSGCRGYALRHV